MAKSVRASVSKRNRANLRKKVFGPIVDARTERLAAKLQEIASQPKPEAPEKSKMMLDDDIAAQNDNDNEKATAADEAMDIDNKSSTTRSSKPGRVQKQHKNRRTRPSIVFSKPGSKNKKGGSKKK
ncbi:hypothetical protein POX_c04453 [Penicillium oxalicum]|uniref:DUF2423 domain-containing protein n=1 Tax=Penicillium oxalicum (strain 114-2 / CGMCC 5302) TaxID=933388 RepID=S7Z6A2_PENO1|nr:hypothetical protein POX_c04453 [Penicillium oxalicum]EPS26075.1 hypothetical protein PDE_01011 [Penicillium oxalicum 114-2]KAI2791590.1 hypothetical protein POX_c04453 [Penicillium oxalicum]